MNESQAKGDDGIGNLVNVEWKQTGDTGHIMDFFLKKGTDGELEPKVFKEMQIFFSNLIKITFQQYWELNLEFPTPGAHGSLRAYDRKRHNLGISNQTVSDYKSPASSVKYETPAGSICGESESDF